MLGCAVNGIGEASHADFGITGAKNEGLIFAHGKPLRKVPQDELVDALFEEIDKSLDRGEVEVDEDESREGADWLAKIEEENAGELTPERIAQMEQRAAESGRVRQVTATRARRRRGRSEAVVGRSSWTRQSRTVAGRRFTRPALARSTLAARDAAVSRPSCPRSRTPRPTPRPPRTS